jgi:hypothetical protein
MNEMAVPDCIIHSKGVTLKGKSPVDAELAEVLSSSIAIRKG